MVNEKFEHYLLTCFNVNKGFSQGNKRNSPEYLDSRFSLFESITVPSVAAQSCSNFSWLVFFDIDTPDSYKERLNSIPKSINFIPFYVSWSGEIKDILKKQLKSESKYLVTTNLDNDDAIAENFIEMIQNRLVEEEVYFINFLMGYMLSNQGLFMREYYSSPFHTVSERVSDEIISCLNIPHHLLFELQQKGVPVYQIICQPLWLQMVHGSNIRNKIETNAIPISNLEELKRFNTKEITFDSQTVSTPTNNRFNLAYSCLRRKGGQSINLKLKLALYTLIPQISIVYNICKIPILSAKRRIKHKYSLEEFRELLLTLKKRFEP